METNRELTLQEVAEYCRTHDLTLRDAKYQVTLYQGHGDPHAHSILKSVWMCSCGWSSERMGCPLHG